MRSCIYLSVGRKLAVKISTRQVQMRWLLQGLGDGILIGLFHVMPITHLRVSDQPILDLHRVQESFIRQV